MSKADAARIIGKKGVTCIIDEVRGDHRFVDMKVLGLLEDSTRTVVMTGTAEAIEESFAFARKG